MSAMADSMRDGPIAIRRWDEAHLGSLISAIERSIDELRLWMHWAAEGAPSPESQRTVLQRAVADFDRDVDWQYSIFEAAGDALVGGCGLHRTASDDCAEISYWVRSDRHGRGYATAAARCLTSAAFGALPQLNTVEIRTDCANVASARVPEKLGYRLVRTESHEVLAHGHTGRRYVWSAARATWPNSNPAQR
jgi:RimJ/RimL family protein N-acetyltransferase